MIHRFKVDGVTHVIVWEPVAHYKIGDKIATITDQTGKHVVSPETARKSVAHAYQVESLKRGAGVG